MAITGLLRASIGWREACLEGEGLGAVVAGRGVVISSFTQSSADGRSVGNMLRLISEWI